MSARRKTGKQAKELRCTVEMVSKDGLHQEEIRIGEARGTISSWLQRITDEIRSEAKARLEEITVSVTINGELLMVPLSVTLNIKAVPIVTKDILRGVVLKEPEIMFGDARLKMLLGASCGRSVSRSLKEYKLLRVARYLDNEGLTQKGKDVVEKLLQEPLPDHEDITAGNIANALVAYHSYDDAYFHWVRYNELSNKKGVTKKGEEWLRSHAKQLLRCGRQNWHIHRAAISYLPLEELPEFLASEDETIRTAAARRKEETCPL